MIFKTLLLTGVLALALPATAAAHDYDADGNTAYVGTACGGFYLSPFTHQRWEDCAVPGIPDQEERTGGCPDEYGNPTCTAVSTFRYYGHFRRDGVFDQWTLSYYSWRFVDLRFE